MYCTITVDFNFTLEWQESRPVGLCSAYCAQDLTIAILVVILEI